MNENQKIGFLGAGNMAAALARGVASAGVVDPAGVLASDPSEKARSRFTDALPGATVTAQNRAVASEADVLVVAVKPPHVQTVLDEVHTHLASKLVISIAAGVPLATLESAADASARVVRAMPNTPCLVQAGATAFALGTQATSEDAELVKIIFSAVGIVFQLGEELLDAVTGLSGSGPAFVYTVIEALSDGGVSMGLPRAVATALSAQTVFGAAKLVADSKMHPALLRDAVASPAGTTIAGLAALERNGLRSALIDAVQQATLRSLELREQ